MNPVKIPVSQKSNSIQTKAKVHSGKTEVQVEDRRRSQRVLLRVPALVHVNVAGKPATMQVTTLSVNHHGAMIVAPQHIPESSQLVLEHGQTHERVACRVSRSPREMPEGFHTPLEFDPPAPGFWRIAFPPTDWRPPDDL
jgi:hypothetical protein